MIKMISIIIIVKSDRGIENTLNKLVKIRKPEKTEILVIDSSEGKLDDIKKKYSSVRWVYFINKTNKKITIPEQRNLGIKKSKGDIIVFIDANCIPSDNWLVELTKPIRDEGEDIVAGSIRSINKESIWNVQEERFGSKNYLEDAPTMNLAFKKYLVDIVGYFDENFNYSSDQDFCWRLTNKHYKIRRNRDAVLCHDWGDLKQEIKRAFRYGEARVTIYKKYPSKIKYLLGYDMITLLYPLFIVFLPLTYFYHFYLLLIFIPIIKNINRQPLKVTMINFIHGFGVLKELFFPIKIREIKK